MTTQNPTAIVARYFDALREGNVPAALDCFSPAIIWHQPGENRFSGEHHGLDGIGALLGGFHEVSQGTFELEVTGPLQNNGALVAVPVRFRARRKDASLDSAGIDLLTVHDGRISEVHLFTADAAAEDAFWGKD